MFGGIATRSHLNRHSILHPHSFFLSSLSKLFFRIFPNWFLFAPVACTVYCIFPKTQPSFVTKVKTYIVTGTSLEKQLPKQTEVEVATHCPAFSSPNMLKNPPPVPRLEDPWPKVQENPRNQTPPSKKEKAKCLLQK